MDKSQSFKILDNLDINIKYASVIVIGFLNRSQHSDVLVDEIELSDISATHVKIKNKLNSLSKLFGKQKYMWLNT